MKQQISQFLRPSKSRRQNGNGYALLIVMMMAAVLMVSLGAALPSVYQEGQREKEAELIFRGEQYARAIELYHAQFNRYPSSVKELLHTNDLSFLRRAYRDPMTKSGKWRFIHATANGIILDSKILKPQNRPTLNDSNSNSDSNSKSDSNSQTDINSQKPNADNSESSVAGTEDQNNSSAGGFSLFGNQNAQSESGANSNADSSSNSDSQSNGGSSFFGGQPLGTYIVGVASTSNKRSIRKFDNRTEYDEWEFLGIPGAPGAPAQLGAGGVGSGVSPANGQNGQNGNSFSGPGSPTNPILVPNP